MCARSGTLKFKGISDLKALLDCEGWTWSLERFCLVFLPKQSCFTDWEAGIVSLKVFERLLDFSQQHVTKDKKGRENSNLLKLPAGYSQ